MGESLSVEFWTAYMLSEKLNVVESTVRYHLTRLGEKGII